MHGLRLEAFEWDPIQQGAQLRPGRIVVFETPLAGVSEEVHVVTHSGAVELVHGTHSDGDVAICLVRSLDVGCLYAEGRFRHGVRRSCRVAMLLQQSAADGCLSDPGSDDPYSNSPPPPQKDERHYTRSTP